MPAKRGAGLTAKQQRFVEEYLKDLNATDAARRAGYSENSANKIGPKLLVNVGIAKAIAEAKTKRAKRVEASQEYVVNTLLEVAERCMQRAPVRDSHGEPATDDDGKNIWRFDAKGVVSAIVPLGKHLGMFSDRLEISGKGGASMSDLVREALQDAGTCELFATLADRLGSLPRIGQPGGPGMGQHVGEVAHGQTPEHPQPPTPVGSEG